MKKLTEEEYFERYYPKSWGDWRKEYNIGEYRNQKPRISGVTWMDYIMTGFLLSERDNCLVEVIRDKRPNYLDSFFISVEDAAYLQPMYQPKDETWWIKGYVRRLESNLTIYELHISGGDDSSYTKHYLDWEDLQKDLLSIYQYGVEYDSPCYLPNLGFFFTN